MNETIAPANFFDPAVLADPFAFYQEAMADAPVQVVPGTNIFLALNYASVSEATSRVEDFSNNFTAILAGQRSEDAEVAAILAKGWPQRETLLTADPPVHTRFRKLVNLAFSMKRVDALEAHIREIANSLIDRFVDAGECEFVTDFAVPLPVTMIAEQIGLDRTDMATVKRWSDAFTDRLGGMISKERELECAAEVVEFQHAMKVKIDERRANPADDLLSDLVNARIDDERPLDDAELLSILQQLMVAGNETTTSSLAGGLVHLIRNPDQADKVRADPSLTLNLVEEVLRLESPTSGMWRVVPKDTELGGVAIPAGSMLMVRFASANRDPAKFENPDTFDVTRSNARAHLAFGRGIHMCVGNMLSRKEMAVAFGEILRRLEDIRITDEAALVYPPNMLLRGLTKLPIAFRAARMNFDLDDNQSMFKDSVERFAGSFDIAERHRVRATAAGFDGARWQELARLGLIALAAPEDKGGLGGSLLDTAVVAEALGYGLATEPWLECGFLPARLLADTAWLDAAMSGSSIAALAFAEAQGRFTLDAKVVVARESGDDIVLSGEKHFVLGGAAADLFIVSAKMGGDTELFAIPGDTTGLHIKPYVIVDGSKAAALTLHNVKIDRSNRIAGGMEFLERIVAEAWLMASAEILGLSARLFDETLNYVKTREQFGQPIGRFQTIQHRMVENYTALEQMRSALFRALLDDGDDWQRGAAGTKAFISEKALAIGHEAMQLHGGMGMTDELMIGHTHKRILLLSKLFGDPASNLNEYAKAA